MPEEPNSFIKTAKYIILLDKRVLLFGAANIVKNPLLPNIIYNKEFILTRFRMGPTIYSKQNGGMRMKKKFTILVAFCMVSMAITTILPTVASQPYGGSILTGDNNDPPNYKNYFDLSENVYYYIHATDDSRPFQLKDIDILIMNPGGTPVHANTITTDQYGNAEGAWGGTGTPNQYTIYANYSGENLAIETFRVYDPIPGSADITTYTENYRYNGGTPAYYFSSNDRIYFSIFILDQYGNPYYEVPWRADEIQYWIYHNEIEVDYDSDDTDDEGYIDDSFRPFPTFMGDEIYGIYEINVTREDGTPLNESLDFIFEVADVDIDITPFKAQYVQGDDITINVQASVTGTIDIRMINPDGEVVSSANWTDQNLANGQWTKTYTLLSMLPDGDYEIQVLKSGNLMETKSISIQKYALVVLTDTGAYLPGETMTVLYTITSNRDGSDVSDASLEWIFQYYDLGDASYEVIRDGPDPTGPFGSFQVSIPASAYMFIDPDLWVWANDTGGHSDEKHLSIDIGGISTTVNLGDDKYIAGDFIVVYVEAFVDDTYPLRSGDVKLNVTKDGVQLSAYTKTGLMTDDQGKLMYIFSLQSNTETGIYTIGINVSKEDTKQWDTASTNFEVVEHRDLSVDLGFDKPRYYSGDAVTVTYTALRGEAIEENVNCEYRIYYMDSDSHAHYIAAGTTNTGQFTFTVPSDLVGELYVNVEVTDSDGIEAQRTEMFDISRADILLTPDKNQ
jgi:uncharacterized protein YfaS (alpha-2-macroglobulin family)